MAYSSSRKPASLAQALTPPKQDVVELTLQGRIPRILGCLLEVRVLVIYTGGTIGMKLGPGGLVPIPNYLEKYLPKLPIFHDEEYAVKHHVRERYEKDDTLHYHGVLPVAGLTDTMAYTASALSFMCEHLGKPVVLTGSQVPIYDLRNDGRDNLLGALLIAGQYIIPEVCLYFYNKLYRGNRTTKVDAGSFAAFTSPNLRPLAATEIDITVDWDIVLKPSTEKFQVSTKLDRNIGLLRLFPGITAATVRAFLQPPMQGVVLETYGSGNAPDNQKELLDALEEAIKIRHVIIINCTQCLRGTVSASYATGEALKKIGVLAGGDMTPEAGLTKLCYVLAKNELDLDAKKKMMGESLRGEMTPQIADAKLCLSNSRFIQVIAKSLSITCKEELEAIRDALTPPLACAAAKLGELDALEALREMGGKLFLADYDGRTPLHVATCEGHLNVVQYLLTQGATVYAKDRYGDTPLSNAVRFR
ncbi:60 kDa lysophospholipase-like [Pempheris klunzingeri]|uniref:60 kDa lysophospholipase-like n=1 Tax=Pempheris klunzingeri TaxID=3127111 RepID=UPI0039815B42